MRRISGYSETFIERKVRLKSEAKTKVIKALCLRLQWNFMNNNG